MCYKIKSMKYPFLLISFIIFTLSSLTTNDEVTCQHDAWNEVCAKVDACIFSISLDSSQGDVSDAQSLARQLRNCGRTNRIQNSWPLIISKLMPGKATCSKVDVLSQSFSHIYNTLPCLCWTLSSDHYVFGMRRILI